MREQPPLPADKCFRIAGIIGTAFDQLLAEFDRITGSASYRFEHRLWKDQRDAVQQRIESSNRLHAGALAEIQSLGLHSLDAHDVDAIGKHLLNHPTADRNWLLAFAEDVLRCFCSHPIHLPSPSPAPLRTVTVGPGSVHRLIQQLLEPIGLVDKSGAVEKIAAHLRSRLQQDDDIRVTHYPHLLYRNQHAYLLAICHCGSSAHPFILPIVHDTKGMRVNAVLTEDKDLMQVFSFTRSYVQVACENPTGLAAFIKQLIPHKPLPQLLVNLGYRYYGKKLMLQELKDHLETTGEVFDHAPGIRGMVMIVFTSPACNYVLKVIRDRPRPPKESTKAEVISKYNLVASLDRAGRVADAQRFLKIYFPVDAFAPGLLAELQTEAAESCIVRDGIVELSDVYLERRMVPMNLFLASHPEQANAILLDYGKAIVEMASSNLFPGDMLIKNFGVVGDRRVVFYDYDEVSLVTDCEFLPLPPNSEDEDGTERTLVVYPNQVFPEELIRFLLPAPYRPILMENLGELFTPAYWNALKTKLTNQMYDDKAPYLPNLV